ncbi:MAG: hypothetical protein HC930_09425 [Hydrococcus sp. SU_1_0]|nr:hypothetical protein [Hydrococcus sp. SU_1_0]
MGTPNGSGGGDVPPIGANIASGLGNVAENTVNTASNIGTAGLAAGGAALAGGAAAAANLAGRRNRTENLADADADLDLDLDESITVEEIPSNPVTEFTGQSTKLQVDDQSDDLSAGDNIDLDEVNSTIVDNVSLGSLGGAAVAGGAAAAVSGFTQDAETGTETTDVADSELTTEQATDFTETTDGNVSQEFTGDFVLQEETRDTSVTEEVANLNIGEQLGDRVNDVTTGITDLAGNITIPEINADLDPNLTNAGGTGIIDGITNAGGAAIAGGAAALGGAAAAASGLFNRGDSTTEDTDVNVNLDLPDLSKTPI